MSKIKTFMIALFVFCGFTQANAAVECSGVIKNVTTYNNGSGDEKLYFMLEGGTHSVSLSTQISKSQALAAYAARKPVTFYMLEANITECSGGPAGGSWDNTKAISHYFTAGH